MLAASAVGAPEDVCARLLPVLLDVMSATAHLPRAGWPVFDKRPRSSVSLCAPPRLLDHLSPTLIKLGVLIRMRSIDNQFASGIPNCDRPQSQLARVLGLALTRERQSQEGRTQLWPLAPIRPRCQSGRRLRHVTPAC